VPAQGKVPSTLRAASRAARRDISAAARRVKVKQQDALGIHTAPDKRRHSMRQGMRLARACARDHEQGPVAVLDCGAWAGLRVIVLGADLHPANTMQMFR